MYSPKSRPLEGCRTFEINRRWLEVGGSKAKDDELAMTESERCRIKNYLLPTSLFGVYMHDVK
jgi:hypothetical protein